MANDNKKLDEREPTAPRAKLHISLLREPPRDIIKIGAARGSNSKTTQR